MKPLFTIHAGEYLLGTRIEEKFPRLNIWIPSKDTGTDLLVTDSTNKKTLSLQVKFSKCFLRDHPDREVVKGLVSMGWWNLKREQLASPRVDLWVLVVSSLIHTDFIILPPQELLQRLEAIHGKVKTLRTYFWVTEEGRCWECRGLKRRDHIAIAGGKFEASLRDFTKYLNDWQKLEEIK